MGRDRRQRRRRAAVVGGAAVAAKKHHDAKQAQTSELESRQSASPAGGQPSGGMSDSAIQRLEQLGKLHDQGVLTDEEFAEQKAALLGD